MLLLAVLDVEKGRYAQAVQRCGVLEKTVPNSLVAFCANDVLQTAHIKNGHEDKADEARDSRAKSVERSWPVLLGGRCMYKDTVIMGILTKREPEGTEASNK